MSSPTPLGTVRVHGRWTDAAGQPLRGTISLAPAVPVAAPTADVLIATTRIDRTLDADGACEFFVVRSDDPALSGPMPYTLSIKLADYQASRTVEILGVTDLADAAPVPEPVDTTPVYLLAAALGDTVAPLVDGLVPAEHLPAGSGGTGATDHGQLTGLGDDDHPHYLTAARGDLRYPALAHGHDLSNYATLVISEANAADAVAAHEGANDPHPGYVAAIDPRLSDARTPTAHAATHATAGTDPLTPAAIGAQPAGSYAAPADVTAAVDAHEAAADPHPGYATDADLAGHEHPGALVTASPEGTPPAAPEVGDVWIVT